MYEDRAASWWSRRCTGAEFRKRGSLSITRHPTHTSGELPQTHFFFPSLTRWRVPVGCSFCASSQPWTPCWTVSLEMAPHVGGERQQRHHNINAVIGDGWILWVAELVSLAWAGGEGDSVWSAVTPLLVLEMILLLLPSYFYHFPSSWTAVQALSSSLCHVLIFYVCLLKEE